VRFDDTACDERVARAGPLRAHENTQENQLAACGRTARADTARHRDQIEGQAPGPGHWRVAGSDLDLEPLALVRSLTGYAGPSERSTCLT
jgi:hypothetical protein